MHTHTHTPTRLLTARGAQELVQKIVGLQLHLGGCLDPHACFLVQRGIQTLPLRVQAQTATARALATWLQQQPQAGGLLMLQGLGMRSSCRAHPMQHRLSSQQHWSSAYSLQAQQPGRVGSSGVHREPWGARICQAPTPAP